MKKTIKKAELLSPVGSQNSLVAAVSGGCDAVYLSGKSFNAREAAENFSDDEIEEAIKYCHLRGVKVNIALNTLCKNEELNNVLSFASKAYEYGADAFILQDIGIFELIKNNFPDIRLHASTQMTIHSLESALMLQKLGFDRIVLARELSLNEIADITDKLNIETEIFVHGALCACYSGRCLISSLIGGRSGNRGRCAQPCRLDYRLISDENSAPYAQGCLLSPKDICSIGFINKLSDIGVSALKIEGRMKSPEYTACVTSVYRKYMDSGEAPSDEDMKKLLQVFNRGGSFSEGYFNEWAGKAMMSISSKSCGTSLGTVESYDPNSNICSIRLSDSVTAGDGIEIWCSGSHCGSGISVNAAAGDKITVSVRGNIKKGELVYKSFDKKLSDNLKAYSKSHKKRQVICAELSAHTDKAVTLKLYNENVSICASVQNAERAKNKPLTADDFISRLSKTGNTPFVLDFKQVNIEENIFMPVSALNELRRKATEAFENAVNEYHKRTHITANYTPAKPYTQQQKRLTASVINEEQFNAVLPFGIDRIYIDLNETTAAKLNLYSKSAHEKSTELFVTLPHILRSSNRASLYENIDKAEASDIDGYLVRNFIELNTNKKIISDYTFNITNSAAAAKLKSIYDEITLSPELSLTELTALADNDCEIFAYGRLPLMVTQQCPIGNFAADRSSGKYCKFKHHSQNYSLNDRKNINFPVFTDCFNCISVIYNAKYIFILNKFSEFEKLYCSYRLNFTDESALEAEKITSAYSDFIKYGFVDDRTESIINNEYTYGHFFRGIF